MQCFTRKSDSPVHLWVKVEWEDLLCIINDINDGVRFGSVQRIPKWNGGEINCRCGRIPHGSLFAYRDIYKRAWTKGEHYINVNVNKDCLESLGLPVLT